MKKRIAAVMVCLAIAAISISGTMAYFTADSIATNVITSGDIDIAVVETKMQGNLEVPYSDEKVKIMPGDAISKIVKVHNTGSNPAYVRVAVSEVIELNDGKIIGDEDDLINWTPGSKWTYKDGYYYYNEALAPGEKTDALFSEVEFSAEMDNKYQKSNITINVVANAVQSQNNGNSVFEAAGWSAE